MNRNEPTEFRLDDQAAERGATAQGIAAPQAASQAAAVRGRPGRRLPLARLAAAAGLAVSLAACAQPGGPGPGGPGGGPGPGFRGGPDAMGMGGPGGWHHHGRGDFAAMDPAQRDARIERMVDRMLSGVNATPEQKQKVTAIARQAAADMAPLHQRGRDARRQAMALLAAPTVDRAGLERLRAEQLAAMEQGSRRMTQAMADAAEVLTPEQRAQLAQRFERRFQRRGGQGN